MAHPEEPTLPEDTGQRKNKNINNVLHDISRFLLSEIQRRAFLSPRSVKQFLRLDNLGMIGRNDFSDPYAPIHIYADDFDTA